MSNLVSRLTVFTIWIVFYEQRIKTDLIFQHEYVVVSCYLYILYSNEFQLQVILD